MATVFQPNVFQHGGVFQIDDVVRRLPQSFFGDVPDGEEVRKHWKRRQEEQDEIGRREEIARKLAEEIAKLEADANAAARLAEQYASQIEARDLAMAEQRRQERAQRMAKRLIEPEYDDDEDVIELLLQ